MIRKFAKKGRNLLDKLPAWILSTLVLAAILWLTLASKPLGDEKLPLFTGADKLAHALMFGGLCVAIFLDYSHGPAYKRVPLRFAVATVFASTFLGVAIEFIQRSMAQGRSFDPYDMVADCAGAVVLTLLWMWLQKFVTLPNNS